MIIEGGYDLQQLLLACVKEDPDDGLLGLVCLDADLRLSFCGIVPDLEIDVDTEAIRADQIHSIVAAADRPESRYFAVGHLVRAVERDHPLVLLDAHDQLEAAGAERGLELLGYLVFDAVRWCSTGPMFDFRSYPLAEDLPRSLVIRGPHPSGCGCPGCGTRQGSIVLQLAPEPGVHD
jgi:hypothetical protein